MNMKIFLNLLDRGEKNFQGYVINNIDFDAFEFDGIDFSHADLRDAKVRRTTFDNCNFNGTNFGGCDFERVSFVDSQLVATNFNACMAVELNFDRCDLSESRFTNAQMGDVYFHQSNLSKSQWQNANWCGGFTECDLTQAQMDGMSASSVQIINTIYPNGVSGDLSWYGLEGNGEPPTPDTAIIVNSRNSVELKSAVGIDYSVLRNLLSECRWDAAGEKTGELLGKLLDDYSTCIEPEWIDRVPCTDLLTIDRLWLENSWGHFGLSVQKEIWASIYGGYHCNAQNYALFCKQVWSSGSTNLDKFQDEQSIKLASVGRFPDTLSFFLISFEQEKVLANLYRRLSECQS